MNSVMGGPGQYTLNAGLKLGTMVMVLSGRASVHKLLAKSNMLIITHWLRPGCCWSTPPRLGVGEN